MRRSIHWVAFFCRGSVRESPDGIQAADGWPLGQRLGSKGQARPFGRRGGRNQCAGSKGGIRLGLDEIVMGDQTGVGGAGTLLCRAGGGWVPRGRQAPSALPLHTTGCRVDGVWGERKSPHWCGKARCRFPRHGQRDATGERSGLPCQDARGTTTHILRVALAPFYLP